MTMEGNEKSIKIVVVGPESTGKSTLCAELAAHFSTIWCREYAREYLLQFGTSYSFEDLLTIAHGQIALEEKATAELISLHLNQHKKQIPILFIDTDMYVMKVWCEFVFEKCHPWILNQIVERNYDGYLLCKPDLPWVKDELREYPDHQTRDTLYHHYKDILINQKTPWFEVSGASPNRSKGAISWVEDLMKERLEKAE